MADICRLYFESIFLEKYCILVQILLKFVLKGLINNKLPFVEVIV